MRIAMRGLALLGAVLAAACGGDRGTPASSRVTLLDAGRAPRAPLRYAFAP